MILRAKLILICYLIRLQLKLICVVYLMALSLQWYSFDRAKVTDDVCERFIQFHQDEETQQFLSNCYEKADWLFTQLYYSVAKSVLGWFMTSTSING